MKKTDFNNAAMLIKVMNSVFEYNGIPLACVMWHTNPWKVITSNVTFSEVAKREYEPIAQFRTRDELYSYIKNNY